MLKVNGDPIEIRSFSDGTSFIKIARSVSDHIEDAVTVAWYYEGEQELPALIYLTRQLQDLGCQNIHLHMPYIPNARLDRTHSPREVFTLKYFAEIINGLRFKTVTVLDPHSHVSRALIDRLIIKRPTNHIKAAISYIRSQGDECPMIFYPDEGSMKRYSDRVTLPYAFGIKKRDWQTGEILSFEIHGEEPSGKNVLIVDDICSRGSTILYSARALKAAGAGNLFVFVSHCENTVVDSQLVKSGLIKHFYTTNSIFTARNELFTPLAV